MTAEIAAPIAFFEGNDTRSRLSMAFLQAGAEGLDVHDRGKAPIKTPDNFVNVNYQQLEQDPLLFSNLAVCYQEVFGSDEKSKGTNKIIWGEGAYCSKEGRNKLVPLNNYKEMVALGNTNCADCGAEMLECFPEEEVKTKIQHELSSSGLSFCTVMRGSEGIPVTGFAWGAICRSPEEVGERLIATRYEHEEEKGEFIAQNLISKLKELKVGGTLFFDEMGVLPEARSGIDPVRFLSRDGFEMAHASGVDNATFWTSTKSPIYKITTFLGFQPIMVADDLIFLTHPDTKPLLKIIQNKPEIEIVNQMRRGSKVANV